MTCERPTPKDYEFYETPETYTRWLFDRLRITSNICEPCVGNGAIVRASGVGLHTWVTNDLDPRWGADAHHDATQRDVWSEMDEALRIAWTVSNPPFTPAVEIIDRALEFSRVGVAMHLRASIHEPLKTGIRRSWLRENKPTGILWLPRFAYQRSKTTGKWTTDSVCACWLIWLKDPAAVQFIEYPDEWVFDALEDETPTYRARMDALMKDRAELTSVSA